MNLPAEKLALIERIIQLENEEILPQIKEMLTEPSTIYPLLYNRPQ